MTNIVHDVAIVIDPSLRCTPGDFGAVLSSDRKQLALPAGVVLAVHTRKDTYLATQFLTAALDHPSEVARNLDWAPSDVFRAADNLLTELILRDVVPYSTGNHPILSP